MGIEHIALSCDDVCAASDELKKIGFEIKFIQKNLHNHISKMPFLRQYGDLHSIAYCWNKNGISIELTQHQYPFNTSISHYQILFSEIPTKAVPLNKKLFSMLKPFTEVWENALKDILPRPALWEIFKTSIWYDKKKNDLFRVFTKSILLPVSDLKASEDFWVKGIGFQVVENGITNGKKWSLLRFKAIIPRWSLNLVLTENKQFRSLPYLDDSGFTCLAFLTNNIKQDCKVLKSYNSTNIAEVFNLEVNSKKMKVVVFRGPSNELVELIGLVK